MRQRRRMCRDFASLEARSYETGIHLSAQTHLSTAAATCKRSSDLQLVPGRFVTPAMGHYDTCMAHVI